MLFADVMKNHHLQYRYGLSQEVLHACPKQPRPQRRLGVLHSSANISRGRNLENHFFQIWIFANPPPPSG
jgi:hypothetical protein